MRRRITLFLYGAPNITGCLLAMGGLALLFLGVIHVYWWLIVAGLYGAGVVGWPRSELAKKVETTELSTELMTQQLRVMVDSVGKAIPPDALVELRFIEATLKELLPRLREMLERGTLTDKDAFTVEETVRRYLPDTLGAYLRLPKLYARLQNVAERQTASQLLTSQLKMLNCSLSELANHAFAGEAEKLVMNGKFLEAKFYPVDLGGTRQIEPVTRSRVSRPTHPSDGV
jgi:hypothetical protein